MQPWRLPIESLAIVDIKLDGRLLVTLLARSVAALVHFNASASISRLAVRDSFPQNVQMSKSADVALTDIVARIVSVRGQRVLVDSDLAALYGATTARLNQQVNRNLNRFPADFSFQLDSQELANLMLQFATSSLRPGTHGGTRKPPRVFTEHGAIMASMVLNSPRAVQMSLYVVRAFVTLREVLASNTTLARRLEMLERSVAALDSDTRKQFDQVYEAILGLMGSAPRKN